MFDFPGFVRPLTAGAPAGDKDFAIGGIEVKAGRVPLDVSAGLNAPGYAASRLAWVGIAMLLVIMAGALYRPHKQPKRMATQGRIAKLLSAGPPPPANPAAASAMRATMPWLRLAMAEFRLIGAGRAFKIMALACAVAGVVPDYRHVGSPAALLLLIFALSAHAGRSEARGLLALTGTAMLPPIARRIAFVVAGITWSMLLAVPAGIATVSTAPLSLALATGAIAAIIAITLGSISRSAFAGRIILLILWYGYLSS
jgi:hypothetical protein